MAALPYDELRAENEQLRPQLQQRQRACDELRQSTAGCPARRQAAGSTLRQGASQARPQETGPQVRSPARSPRGRHPLQTSAAVGAAASPVGPDAQAAVVLLNKEGGRSYRQVARVFASLFGLSLTRGACSPIVLRPGRRLRPAYQEIRQRLQESERLTPDETGWRIGGHPV